MDILSQSLLPSTYLNHFKFFPALLFYFTQARHLTCSFLSLSILFIPHIDMFLNNIDLVFISLLHAPSFRSTSLCLQHHSPIQLPLHLQTFTSDITHQRHCTKVVGSLSTTTLPYSSFFTFKPILLTLHISVIAPKLSGLLAAPLSHTPPSSLTNLHF